MITGGRGGSVILISSMAGLRGLRNLTDYTTSKHGLVGLCRALAQDAGRYRIRVNTVHPGAVSTTMLTHEVMPRFFPPDLENPTLADCERVFRSGNLLPDTFQEPEDVANAVLWLASDLSRSTTGTTLTVDGGSSYS